MLRRCASFNVLADEWLSWGVQLGYYDHVTPALLAPGARIRLLVQLIAGLRADVVCLQEVELPLVEALDATGKWETFWSKKKGEEPDGCLTLVRRNIRNLTVSNKDFTTHAYSDGSGHIVQTVVIGGVVFANTHLLYAKPDDPHHAGMAQAKELLGLLKAKPRVAILTDGNDRPGGPVRKLIEARGYTHLCGNEPTALIGQEQAALDLIAVRGIHAKRIKPTFSVKGIPNKRCPSDHVPVMAYVETG